MKKRLKIFAFLALVLSSLVSCSTNEDTPPIPECDPDFEDCTPEEDLPQIELQSYSSSNYTYDDVSNDEGSVSYEIFVRSFYDSNGDGIGDINGVREKLSYLDDLGVKTLWLMPIHPSPSYHGYDVNDYYQVNPDYGTLDDFKALCSEAEELGIDIMIDIVFNHSSNENQWFIDSYNDFKADNHEEGSKIDWYNWSTSSRSGYNRYREDQDAWYESNFSYTMPDLNTENQEVRDEMVNILDYWIDLGCDGFRFDAVIWFKSDNSYNASFMTYLKENIKDPDVYFVGEAWASNDVLNTFYTSKAESFFRFSNSLDGSGFGTFVNQVKGVASSSRFASIIETQEEQMKERNSNAYSSYFLSNHDMNRSSNSFNTPTFAKLAASLYLLMPGRPYIYYGEEISLKGVRNTSPDDQTDALRRLPMIWSKTNKEGECDFPEKGKESLMSTVTQVTDGVDDQLSTNYSLVNHYKKVINIRNKYPFILNSVFKNECSTVTSSFDIDHVLTYSLSYEDQKIYVIHNFSANNIELDVSNIDGEILGEVSVPNLVPELSGSKLKLGKWSTVILG